MNKNNQKLVNEINKLILNILSQEGRVNLPKIGTLSIESNKAKRVVAFSTTEHRPTVVDTISRQGKCTDKQAMGLYEKWLKEVQVGGKTNIAGVGTIENNKFAISSYLERRLNPNTGKKEAAKEEAKESKNGGIKIWIISAVVIVAAFVAVIVVGMQSVEEPKFNIDANEMVSTLEEDNLIAEQPVADIVEVAEPQAEPQVEPQAELPKPQKIQTKVKFIPDSECVTYLNEVLSRSVEPKRYRVVSGIHHYKSNAGRMAIDIDNRSQTDDVVARAYRYNDKNYMVTLYESDHFYNCKSFIRNCSALYYDNLWIYDTKTEE